MANPQNIMKLLQTLGGGSDSYSQGGTLGREGGQPLLQKPSMSMPDALSPYAPGNQGGGVHAIMGGGYSKAADGSTIPNSTKGVVQGEMSGDSPTHPANQLAQYLATNGGATATAARNRRKSGTDSSLFLRGGPAMQTMPGVTVGVRG